MNTINFQRIDDLNLASTLICLGFKFAHPALHYKKYNGKRQYIYFFNSENEDKTYKLTEVVDGWQDVNYTKNHTNLLAELKQYHEIKNTLLDEIKSGKGELVQHGDTFIDKNADPEQVRYFLK